jgi:hypothetical protein
MIGNPNTADDRGLADETVTCPRTSEAMRRLRALSFLLLLLIELDFCVFIEFGEFAAAKSRLSRNDRCLASVHLEALLLSSRRDQMWFD